MTYITLVIYMVHTNMVMDDGKQNIQWGGKPQWSQLLMSEKSDFSSLQNSEKIATWTRGISTSSNVTKSNLVHFYRQKKM